MPSHHLRRIYEDTKQLKGYQMTYEQRREAAASAYHHMVGYLTAAVDGDFAERPADYLLVLTGAYADALDMIENAVAYEDFNEHVGIDVDEAGDPTGYRQARGAIGGSEPAEAVIRRIRDAAAPS